MHYQSENDKRKVEINYSCMASVRLVFIEDKDVVLPLALKTFMDQLKKETGFEAADEIVFQGSSRSTNWFNIHCIGPKVNDLEFSHALGSAVSHVYGIDTVEVFGFKEFKSDINIKVTRKYED